MMTIGYGREGIRFWLPFSVWLLTIAMVAISPIVVMLWAGDGGGDSLLPGMAVGFFVSLVVGFNAGLMWGVPYWGWSIVSGLHLIIYLLVRRERDSGKGWYLLCAIMGIVCSLLVHWLGPGVMESLRAMRDHPDVLAWEVRFVACLIAVVLAHVVSLVLFAPLPVPRTR